MRWLLRSKIHKAVVTQADINYVGSISIDADLLDRVALWPGERVLVTSNTSGARLETYVIPAPAMSGVIGINGAAAHLIAKDEEIIIMGFDLVNALIEPQVILVDSANRFVKYLTEENSKTT